MIKFLVHVSNSFKYTVLQVELDPVTNPAGGTSYRINRSTYEKSTRRSYSRKYWKIPSVYRRHNHLISSDLVFDTRAEADLNADRVLRDRIRAEIEQKKKERDRIDVQIFDLSNVNTNYKGKFLNMLPEDPQP
jgi:hypothetical protein